MSLYSKRGVSAQKEEVHAATRNIASSQIPMLLTKFVDRNVSVSAPVPEAKGTISLGFSVAGSASDAESPCEYAMGVRISA